MGRDLAYRIAAAARRGKGRGLSRRLALGAVVGFAAGWSASGLYLVRPDEAAVITRLGAVHALVGPGLHGHLPWPLEQAQLISVTRINTLVLGGAAEDGSQGLIPTADAQLADVTYAVSWRIDDPIAYLYRIADPQAALKAAARSAMRQAVGAASLASIMSGDRSPLQRAVATAIQQRLNRLDAGVLVTGVTIRRVALPADVQAAAADVINARQDAEASIAAGEAYRARVLAEAKASAAKTLIEAKSYRDQTVAEASGAAARFRELDAAYRRAPAVTRDRLYFETLQGVLSHAHTVILDPAKGATIAVSPDLVRALPQGAAASPSHAPQAPSGSAPAGPAKP